MYLVGFLWADAMAGFIRRIVDEVVGGIEYEKVFIGIFYNGKPVVVVVQIVLPEGLGNPGHIDVIETDGIQFVLVFVAFAIPFVAPQGSQNPAMEFRSLLGGILQGYFRIAVECDSLPFG